MYLRCTEWVNAGYIVHFLAMYLRCTSSVHHPLPPVTIYTKTLYAYKERMMHLMECYEGRVQRIRKPNQKNTGKEAEESEEAEAV